MMKRILSVFLIMILALCACTPAKELTVDGIAEQILSSVSFEETPQKIDEDIALAFYGLDRETAGEFAVYMTSGGFVDEISVWKTSNKDKVLEKINARIAEQKSAFEDYRPEQMPKLDSPVIVQSGDFIACCITADSANAKSVLESYMK